jgi:hypothetical protein
MWAIAPRCGPLRANSNVSQHVKPGLPTPGATKQPPHDNKALTWRALNGQRCEGIFDNAAVAGLESASSPISTL